MRNKKRKSNSLWISLFAVLLVLILRQWPQIIPSSDDSIVDNERRTHKTHQSQEPATPPAASPSLSRDELQLPKSRIHDFDAAKNELRKLFGRGREFYCDCSYDFTRKPNVDPGSCGLKSNSARAQRIEWEHVVPASFYGRQFAEWRKGDPSCTGRSRKGRECARKASPVFRQIEGDMYNLQPSVGELNRVRGDTSYGDVPGEPREFGRCDFERFANKTEPRPEVRGDIARIYFYMDARYPQFHIVNEENLKMLEEWAFSDPIDDAERTRLKKIEAVQGNSFFIGRLSVASKDHPARGRSQ
ncbi:MAG: endonuclease [Oligoflexus sp.]|nr:endonuclease [Oligoflexus sp.]